MSYYFSKMLEADFAAALVRVRDALKEEGFGVISEIDVRAILKAKLDVEVRPYVILGACDPTTAHAALALDDKIGTLLPCNVVIQELGDGLTEVAAVDPVASMRAASSPQLLDMAKAVAARLQAVINSV